MKLEFQSEVTTPVKVEVLSYTPATPGTYSRRPEECELGEPAEVEIAVWLERDTWRHEITRLLAPDVLDDLRDEAVEQLAEPPF